MKMNVKFSELCREFGISFSSRSQTFAAKFGTIQTATKHIGTPYEGDYVVTPKVEAQTMPTKDKVMTDDMTIKGIEIHRVKNSSGGTTVYIAKGE